jgi:hypothetical protein
MVGEYNSVFSRLRVDFPSIVNVSCTCHSIHLAASKACLKLPRSVEDMMRNIYAHFHRSYQRSVTLKDFEELYHVETHNILAPGQTRWLSLWECVKRVLEQYDPLLAYFRLNVFEDPSRTTESIVIAMNNVFTKVYLEFLSYILGLLVDFNVLFQSEMPLLYELKSSVCQLLKQICSNFIQINVIKDSDILHIDSSNKRNYVAIDSLYLGVAAHESISSIRENRDVRLDDIAGFLDTCLQFYVELVSVIQLKFKFDDNLFDMLDILNVDHALSLQTPTLAAVLKRFPILAESVNLQDVDKEWRNLAFLDLTKVGIDECKKKTSVLAKSNGVADK